ncbi:MAG: hypothetical protein KDK66_04455 [Deltaproteobacteria bacterium]|nr:hypothetical protein [Deltaproteobacteria bacterium]
MNGETIPNLEEMKDILDIQGFALWDLSLLQWIALALLGLLILILAYLIYRRFFRKKNLPIPLSPLAQALQRLDSLKIPSIHQVKEVRVFYFELSECFRSFLEGEKKLEAKEATSEELKPLLEKSRFFNQEELKNCFEFLETADLAKFARWLPEKEALPKHYEFCRHMILQLANPEPKEKEET